jgi:hypothetical protein
MYGLKPVPFTQSEVVRQVLNRTKAAITASNSTKLLA